MLSLRHGQGTVTSGRSTAQRVVRVLPVGAICVAILAWIAPWQLTVLTAWSVMAATLLVVIWLRITQFDEAQTKDFATREDPSRPVTELLLLCASSGALLAVGFGLAKAYQSRGVLEGLLIAASAAAIVVSWGVINTVFTLRYAHAYYTEPSGGVDFNDDHEPVYLDFTYLALTIGMTFQVSDTNITARKIRRIIIPHALLSFLFVTAIIASSISILASLLNN